MSESFGALREFAQQQRAELSTLLQPRASFASGVENRTRPESSGLLSGVQPFPGMPLHGIDLIGGVACSSPETCWVGRAFSALAHRFRFPAAALRRSDRNHIADSMVGLR